MGLFANNNNFFNIKLVYENDNLIDDVREMFNSMNLMNISDFVQGYYEESCAYSHVTPYAFFNNLKIYRSNALIREQYIVINMLMIQLYTKIIDVFNLDDNDPDLKHVEDLLVTSLTRLVLSIREDR